ncbi:hypothetical protein SCLCIDRAFT_1212579 [Scleroderma citrinum Foug A]|uniref:Uncharacterized protein n=1 Tax=Scleroderma citrinum Foug A TaxID=1036808 RepID=A0A0C3EAX9_9AGAM|nr:hypothetical protein SCLCIDRAFT_1212579 [Scleroderma citrinum Foug A]
MYVHTHPTIKFKDLVNLRRTTALHGGVRTSVSTSPSDSRNSRARRLFDSSLQLSEPGTSLSI